MSFKHYVTVGSLAALFLVANGCSDSGTTSDPPIPRADAQGQVDNNEPAAKQGPDQYWVKFETTKGDVIIECNRKGSPYGSDRFYELIKSGFFDGCKFFRVVPGFVVQWGINGDPQVEAKWRSQNIPDDHFLRGDKNRQSNVRGTISFAKAGPNTRTTQVFINTKSNTNLDGMGFTPFGRVISGMAAVDAFYDGYEEEPQKFSGRIEMEGNAYLEAAFPKLDGIKKAILLPEKPILPKTPAG
jgi:peptidyl-prolyl cis-trans isomerase A (cyclophilin A)